MPKQIQTDSGRAGLAQAPRSFQGRILSNFSKSLLNSSYTHQNGGANYEELDHNIVDGIFFDLLDSYGAEVWYDIFSLYLPPDESLPCLVDSESRQATLLAAGASASVGEDLRDRSRNDYGFPIDDAAWPGLLSCAEDLVNARMFSMQDACAAIPDRLLKNGFESNGVKSEK